MSDLIERPTDAADPTYPDAERCAQTLEACEDDLLTEAQFVRWQGQEIERLTAERDELRRQLDPMGEYASADELIAALRAEKAEDDAMKRDARRYRWLSGDLCPDHSIRWTQWEVRCWRAPQWTADLRRSELDAAIDAAMGGSDE